MAKQQEYSMKRQTYYLKMIIIFLCGISCMPGCVSSGNQQPDLSLVEIDVSKNYPEKKLHLLEIAEIEYIQLKTAEDFLVSPYPTLVTQQFFIFHSFTTGDILFFDWTGTPVKKFSRSGSGPEEYMSSGRMTYDETTDEVFIYTVDSRIAVYTSDGDFKRTLSIPDHLFFMEIRNYDQDYLLCYNNRDVDHISFVPVSKEDGQIKPIPLPFEEKLDLLLRIEKDGVRIGAIGHTNYSVKYKEGFLLSEFSTDTVYRFTQNQELLPALIRKPPVRTMDPLIYLNSYLETSDYLFLTTVKRIYDFETREGFPMTGLLMDKKDGKIYEPHILFDEYKDLPITIGPHLTGPTDQASVGYIILQTDQLMDTWEAGRLTGELNERAAAMDIEDHPVYMILKFK